MSKFSGLNGLDLAKKVSTKKIYTWNKGTHALISSSSQKSTRRFRVYAYDFGIKKNILRILYDIGCDITVVPADYPFTELQSKNPDGVFLSNGPGDPSACNYAIDNIRELKDPSKIVDNIASHLNSSISEKQQIFETLDIKKRLNLSLIHI